MAMKMIFFLLINDFFMIMANQHFEHLEEQLRRESQLCYWRKWTSVNRFLTLKFLNEIL